MRVDSAQPVPKIRNEWNDFRITGYDAIRKSILCEIVYRNEAFSLGIACDVIKDLLQSILFEFVFFEDMIVALQLQLKSDHP